MSVTLIILGAYISTLIVYEIIMQLTEIRVIPEPNGLSVGLEEE